MITKAINQLCFLLLVAGVIVIFDRSLLVLGTGDDGVYPARRDISSLIACTIGPMDTTLSLSSSECLWGSSCSAENPSIVTEEVYIFLGDLGKLGDGEMTADRILKFLDNWFTSSKALYDDHSRDFSENNIHWLKM